jgi:hypothetical protein
LFGKWIYWKISWELLIYSIFLTLAFGSMMPPGSSLLNRLILCLCVTLESELHLMRCLTKFWLKCENLGQSLRLFSSRDNSFRIEFCLVKTFLIRRNVIRDLIIPFVSSMKLGWVGWSSFRNMWCVLVGLVLYF